MESGFRRRASVDEVRYMEWIEMIGVRWGEELRKIELLSRKG